MTFTANRGDAMTGVREARSFLFVPGDRPERFAKALASGADAVVIDLEDAVAASRRPVARGMIAEYLANADRPEKPYATFFVHGRGFDGFHNRFQDIARGGPEPGGVERVHHLAHFGGFITGPLLPVDDRHTV